MAVRPIDANELYRIEKLLDTDIVRQDKVALNLLEQVLYDIQHVPTLTQPNEPLTLEVLAKSQLLQRLGEKVEVIRMGEMCQAEWATVRSFGGCKTDSGSLCCHELYGKTWIAYRRPPEGEEKYDA